MSDLRSFQSLDSWLEQIALHSDPDIGIVLVGTKYDKEDKTVAEDMAKTYADEHHMALFFASSATGQNISMILEHVAASYGNRLNQVAVPESTRVIDEDRQKRGCC
jgi:GTPase SAR1 family protein